LKNLFVKLILKSKVKVLNSLLLVLSKSSSFYRTLISTSSPTNSEREKEREGGMGRERVHSCKHLFTKNVYLLLFAFNSAAFAFAHALASSPLDEVTALAPPPDGLYS